MPSVDANLPAAATRGATPEVPADGASRGSGGVEAPSSPAHVVEHFFRHEAGRLHGALMRLLGPGNMSTVEDIAQAALLQAMRTWSIGGIPPNPSAWITRVAMNLAKDHLRHYKMSASKETNIITHFEQMMPSAAAIAEGEAEIRDDALRLMFVCCHPLLPPDGQVVLALKVMFGFSTGEIARAFLSSEAAIEKQLTRTKQRIREAGVSFEIPTSHELEERLDGVLSALYLLFNEGYKASAGDRLLREDLCQEAVRITALLVEHPAGQTPRSHALLALMLLTAARFPSRTDERGDLLTLRGQDRSKWDQALIGRGLLHLARASEGDVLSEYHLQAGIAALHCTAPDFASTDWSRILRHYDELARIKPTPVVALNRAVAVAHVHGPRSGLDAVAAIPQREKLESHYLLHAVTGELHWRLKNHSEAAASFRRAILLAHVGPEQSYLNKMLQQLNAGGDADQF